MVSNEKVLPVYWDHAELSAKRTAFCSTAVHSGRKLFKVKSLHIYLLILLAVLTLDHWLRLVSNLPPYTVTSSPADESWVNIYCQQPIK